MMRTEAISSTERPLEARSSRKGCARHTAFRASGPQPGGLPWRRVFSTPFEMVRFPAAQGRLAVSLRSDDFVESFDLSFSFQEIFRYNIEAIIRSTFLVLED